MCHLEFVFKIFLLFVRQPIWFFLYCLLTKFEVTAEKPLLNSCDDFIGKGDNKVEKNLSLVNLFNIGLSSIHLRNNLSFLLF